MRNLASIQTITSLEPIEGADRIELAHVLGWQCVVGKGDFKPGDKIVYFEIDSFLPIREEFEILRKNSYKKNDFMGEGFKVKTMKFKGQISQGLVMPIHAFSELTLTDFKVGTDVTDILHVREWEVPEVVTVGGTTKGTRPDYIPKTDETRIQSKPQLLEEFRGLPYYITTKLDGSSHSIGYNNGKIDYTSHNMTLIDDGKNAFINYCKEKGYDAEIIRYCEQNDIKHLVLQGEWCGEGIQKNRLKLKKPEWFVFTVRINDERTNLDTMYDLSDFIGFKMVPVQETSIDLPSKYPTVDALIERAGAIHSINDTVAEGIVIRPTEPVYSKSLQGSLSMKVINNKYLLKNED